MANLYLDDVTKIILPTGRRYREYRRRRQTILLFARESKKINGLSAPFYFLGPADYVCHAGSRPMSIIRRLRYQIPARMMRKTARAASR